MCSWAWVWMHLDFNWNHVTQFRLNWFQQNINRIMIDRRNSCIHMTLAVHLTHVLLFVYTVWVFFVWFIHRLDYKQRSNVTYFLAFLFEDQMNQPNLYLIRKKTTFEYETNLQNLASSVIRSQYHRKWIEKERSRHRKRRCLWKYVGSKFEKDTSGMVHCRQLTTSRRI